MQFKAVRTERVIVSMESDGLGDAKGAPFKRTFLNLGVFQFLTFLRRGVFYTFMITYLFMLMQTVTYTAALGTLNMIASSLGQNLLWGRICDRSKSRVKLIIAGESIAALFYIIVFLVHRSFISSENSFEAGLAIIFGLSILEFFWSMSDVGWAALMTDVTTPEIRGRTIGLMNFVASLGRMVGILFAGFLYNDGEGFSSGTIFYIVTILLLVGATLMAFTSRHMKARDVRQEDAADPRETSKDEIGDENEKKYKWFLLSLIIIVLGAALINQIFLLFIQLPHALNATDPEMGFILTAWTVGGMIASLASGRLADKIGRSKVILLGFCLAIVTPILYSLASSVLLMAFIYGVNGVSFWTIQTVGFAFAGDLIPEHRRGRLLSRYNTVMALSWGPAGFLIGGPLADLQVKILGLSSYTAYVNTFYISSAILILGTALFATKFANLKPENKAKVLNPIIE
jgi:MFS family permease